MPEELIIKEAQSFFDEGKEEAAFGLLDLLTPRAITP